MISGVPVGDQFGGMGGGGYKQAGWDFKSNVDPEELFRTIFGDRGSPFGNFGQQVTVQELISDEDLDILGGYLKSFEM